MTTMITPLDIIRLATERGDQTGDSATHQFHRAVECIALEMKRGDPRVKSEWADLHSAARAAAAAIADAQAAQLEFRELLTKKTP